MTVTIGQQLLQPESGWKRYDATHSIIKSTGTVGTSPSPSNYYAGTGTIWIQNINSKQAFRFVGSKLRLISSKYTNRGEAEIIIDGVSVGKFNQYNSTILYQILIFEITELAYGEHLVEIKMTSDGYYSDLDAIDIDSTGRLLHTDEVTDIKDLQVGKRIRCHYQATSNAVGVFSNLGQETYVDGINDFIPPVSSANPDGDFYFIMVEDWNGKKRLIADRNIQHSISWDTLNSEGIASGSGVETLYKITDNLIPIMTSNTEPEGIVSANEQDGSPAYYAFDGDPSTYWATSIASSSISGWVGYEFIESKKIVSYKVHAYTHDMRRPRNFKFEGYNEETLVWDTLDARTGILNSDWIANKEQMRFHCKSHNGKEYKKYRLLITRNDGGESSTRRHLVGLEMYESAQDDFLLITRLLTGGISSTDKDNEWDQYIVNSTLDGTITAGDNNVWNWSSHVSHTSTAPTGYPQYRVVRGRNSSSYYAYIESADKVSDRGFRPVLEIESLFQEQLLYLVGDNDGIKAYDPTKFEWEIVGSTINHVLFETHGMSDLTSILQEIHIDILEPTIEDGMLADGKLYRTKMKYETK